MKTVYLYKDTELQIVFYLLDSIIGENDILFS